MLRSILINTTTPAVMAICMLNPALADDIAPMGGEIPAPNTSRTFPAVFGAASAISSAAGSHYVSLNYSTPRGGVSGGGADGSISAGLTFGNPTESLGVTAGVNINSLANNFGDSGNFNVSLSRLISVKERSVTFIGASGGNLAGWGDASDTETSYATYASHLIAFDTPSGEIPLQLTAGYGNQTTLSDDGLGTLDGGFFVGAGLGITKFLSASVSFTKTQANLGATVIIPSVDGLALTAGVYDAADNAARRQYSVYLDYSF